MDKHTKRTEYIFVIITVMLFFILFNKYILNNIGIDTIGLAESRIKSISDVVNKKGDFQIRRIEKNVDRSHDNFYLSFDKNSGNWKLSNGNGGMLDSFSDKDENLEVFNGMVTTNDYLVKNEGGKVAIESLRGKTFEISLEEGTEKYYSVGNKVLTDISFDGSDSKIYEQEDFIPMLGYHHIIKDSEEIKYPTLEIKEKDFSRQIEYLTNTYGCRWFIFEDIMQNYVLPGKKTPKMACVLNFDDGNLDNYTIAYPILKKYNAVASFYIIPGDVGKTGRMSWKQLEELYTNGNEIGSHTTGGGSLMTFAGNHDELVRQIYDSKAALMAHGFGDVKTFAYPLGEWNDEIVQIVKDAGYIAARDTSKDNGWRDRRAQSASMDEEFTWHMYYHKPEMDTPEALVELMAYNTWWQFEEGYKMKSDPDDDTIIRSSINPTSSSYAIVSLPDHGDSLSNKFTVSRGAKYVIEILASAGRNIKGVTDIQENNLGVIIDSTIYPFNEIVLKKDSCFILNEWNYCSYLVRADLSEGPHTISIEAAVDNIKLDKFRVYRELPANDTYRIGITEVVDGDVGEQTGMKAEKNKTDNFIFQLFIGGLFLFVLLLMKKKRRANE